MTPQELLNAPLEGGDGLDYWMDLAKDEGHFGDEYDTPAKWQARKIEIAQKIIDLIEGKK